MKISFHGADLGVTGSCHLVECGGKQILIDCGLYQGGRELNEENREPLGFEPADVDYLLLTHARLDHCGRIPLLVNRGFRGEIITTSASRELAKLVMLDAPGLKASGTCFRSAWCLLQVKLWLVINCTIVELLPILENVVHSFSRSRNHEQNHQWSL